MLNYKVVRQQTPYKYASAIIVFLFYFLGYKITKIDKVSHV